MPRPPPACQRRGIRKPAGRSGKAPTPALSRKAGEGGGRTDYPEPISAQRAVSLRAHAAHEAVADLAGVAFGLALRLLVIQLHADDVRAIAGQRLVEQGLELRLIGRPGRL